MRGAVPKCRYQTTFGAIPDINRSCDPPPYGELIPRLAPFTFRILLNCDSTFVSCVARLQPSPNHELRWRCGGLRCRLEAPINKPLLIYVVATQPQEEVKVGWDHFAICEMSIHHWRATICPNCFGPNHRVKRGAWVRMLRNQAPFFRAPLVDADADILAQSPQAALPRNGMYSFGTQQLGVQFL